MRKIIHFKGQFKIRRVYRGLTVGKLPSPKLAKFLLEFLKWKSVYFLLHLSLWQTTKININLHKWERLHVSPTCRDLKKPVYEKSAAHSKFQTFRNYLVPQPCPSNLQFLATPLACIPTFKMALALRNLKLNRKDKLFTYSWAILIMLYLFSRVGM